MSLKNLFQISVSSSDVSSVLRTHITNCMMNIFSQVSNSTFWKLDLSFPHTYWLLQYSPISTNGTFIYSVAQTRNTDINYPWHHPVLYLSYPSVTVSWEFYLQYICRTHPLFPVPTVSSLYHSLSLSQQLLTDLPVPSLIMRCLVLCTWLHLKFFFDYLSSLLD